MLSRGRIQRRLRQVHFALAAVIGAKVFLWFASGLFMVAFDINSVRGDHLRAEVPVSWLPESGLVAPEIAMAAADFPANQAELTMLRGTPVWIIQGGNQRAVVDAETGTRRPSPDAALMEIIAQNAYRGRGTLKTVTLLDEAPRDSGRSGPIWRAEFGPVDQAVLYFDPITGEAGAIRTPLWQAFDFMWGLHIMDWSTRENFNSWWVKATAAFAVLFSLSGMSLVATRLLRRRRLVAES